MYFFSFVLLCTQFNENQTKSITETTKKHEKFSNIHNLFFHWVNLYYPSEPCSLLARTHFQSTYYSCAYDPIFFQSESIKNRSKGFMFAGLFFSWAGDMVLEFSVNNGNMFILGLVFFLLAHIMYLTVFIITPGKNSLFR